MKLSIDGFSRVAFVELSIEKTFVFCNGSWRHGIGENQRNGFGVFFLV